MTFFEFYSRVGAMAGDVYFTISVDATHLSSGTEIVFSAYTEKTGWTDRHRDPKRVFEDLKNKAKSVSVDSLGEMSVEL